MELTAVLSPAKEGDVAFNHETGTTTEGESIEEALTEPVRRFFHIVIRLSCRRLFRAVNSRGPQP